MATDPEGYGASPLTRRRLGPVALTAGATYLGMGLSFISTPMVAHDLGAHGRGVLAGAFVLMQMMSWIGYLGLPRGIAIQEKSGFGYRSSSALALTALGAMSAVATFALAGPISNGDPQIRLGIQISAALLLGSGLGQFGTELMLVHSKMMLWNLQRLAVTVLPSLAIIVAFLLGALTIEAAYLSMLAGQIIAIAIGCGYFFIHRSTRTLTRTRPPGSIPWRMSIKLWSASAFDSLGRIDQLALTAFASAAVLGNYAVAATCAIASGALTQAISHVSYSSFFDATRASGHFRRKTFVALATSTASGLLILCALIFLGPLLLGPGYHQLPLIFAILAVFQALQDQWQLRTYFDAARKHVNGLLLASGFAVAVLAIGILIFKVTGTMNAVNMALLVVGVGIVRLSVRGIIRQRDAAKPERQVQPA